MRGGLRATDSAWVRSRLENDLARAAELERLGHWQEALRLNDAIGRDYAPWPESTAAAARASALRSSRVVKRYQAEARELAARDQRQAVDLRKTLEWARSQREPPALNSLVRKLRIPELLQLDASSLGPLCGSRSTSPEPISRTTRRVIRCACSKRQ
jgi:hypothetical protein